MPKVLNPQSEQQFEFVAKYLQQEIIGYCSKFLDEPEQITEKDFHAVLPERHTLIMASARKYRLLAHDFNEFVEALSNALKSMDYEKFGYSRNSWHLKNIVIWHPDKKQRGEGRCVSFPNLTLSTTGVSRYRYTDNTYGLKEESHYFPRHSASLIADFMNKLATNHPSVASIPRGLKRLNERRFMHLTRVLSRSLLIRGKRADPTFIDNLAEKMVDVYKPMEYRHAVNPNDMQDMYLRGPDSPTSCMDSTHSFEASPVHWYGYCPITEGRYVARGNNVLARAIIYQNISTKEWFYSRVYYTRDVYGDELKKQMKKEGIKNLSGRESLLKGANKHIAFSVPNAGGENRTARKLCGFPYFDFVPAVDCAFTFNKLTDCFDFELFNGSHTNITKGLTYPNRESTCGVIYADGNNEDRCQHCGEHMDEPTITTTNGYHFCSVGCAEEDDFVCYITSNNEEWRAYTDVPYLSLRNDPSQTISCVGQPAIVSNETAGYTNDTICSYYPRIWAETEYPVFTETEMYYDGFWGFGSTENFSKIRMRVTTTDNKYSHHVQRVLFAKDKVVSLCPPLLTDRPFLESEDTRNVKRYVSGLNDYQAYFFSLGGGNNIVDHEPPTLNVEGFDRVSLSSFPEDGISYTFCTVKERTDFTDFDSCIFDDYYGYTNYRDESHGELFPGVNIITNKEINYDK